VLGSKSIKPDECEIKAGEKGPLRIVVSLKTAGVSVEITGMPENHKDMIALLSPADPYLTLHESGILNKVVGTHTQFRFIPPGKYTLLILDAEVQNNVAFSAAVREALKDRATVVQVPEEGSVNVLATYVPAEVVQRVIRESGMKK
jgi:hypothetical protein